ncbi:phage tail length tape measure family protein [Roseibium sp.]|uniref:phage tail length tape measure family protein n=1 Tax=Roseibium sp. TaxID=1936156 RepID=UPI003A96E2AF
MTLQLKMLASLDASGVARGAREAQSHLRLVGNEATKTGTRLSQALDAQFGIGGVPAADRARDIEAYGAQLDDLRAKFNPLFALQRRYETGVREIADAHKVGAISAKEAANATAQATGIYKAQRAALAGSTQVLGALGSSSKLAASEINILGQQFADAGIQIASGQSLFTAILQQGSQVQFMLGSKGVNTIGGSLGILKQGLIGFLNPINLALVGLAGGAAAATALYHAVTNDDSAEDALENQNELIRQMAERYKEVKLALDQLDRSPTLTNIALDTDDLEQQRDLLQGLISEIEDSVQRSLRLEANALTALAEPLTEDAALFRDFQAELRLTAGEFINAETGADQLIARLIELARTAPDTESEQAIREIIKEARQADTGLFDLVKRLNEVETALRGVDAAASAIGAISTAANDRIGATFAIFDEQTARERLASQLNRGKKNSRSKVDRTAERTQDLIRSQDEELARLRLETQLIGSTDLARSKALATLEAEIQIRDLGITALGSEADAIRANALAIADSTNTLEQNQQAWDTVRSSGESAIDTLVDRLANGDLSGAIQAVTSDLSQMVLMLGAANPLKNALFGSSLPTLSSAGGLLSGLLGGSGGSGVAGAVSAATLGLYDIGGATPAGNDNDIAGFVHKNEYVFDARSTRAIGVPVLEAMRKGAQNAGMKGYQSGGLVTTDPMSLPSVAGQARLGITQHARPNAMVAGEGHSNVTINITTPDAQSFRAARTQIAGEFARLTARGQRGL